MCVCVYGAVWYITRLYIPDRALVNSGFKPPKLQTPSLGQVIGPAIAKGAGQHGAPTCPEGCHGPRKGVNKE